MKSLLLFLRVMLFVILLILIVRMGLQILIFGLRFWFISIPVLILAYLLLSNYWKNKKAQDEFLHTPFHPYREVKPDKEPEVTDPDIEDSNRADPIKKDQEDT